MLIGIAGSLIASLILLFLSLFKPYISPIFVEIFGEKIKIHEFWYTELDFGSGNLHKVKMQIKKIGYKVSGYIEFLDGKHLNKKYYIKGQFKSNILTFHYFPYNKLSTSQGTATCMRLNDGEILKGYFAYFSQDENKVDTVDCQFIPIPNRN